MASWFVTEPESAKSPIEENIFAMLSFKKNDKTTSISAIPLVNDVLDTNLDSFKIF